MIPVACWIAIGAISVASLLCIFRLARGPGVADRVLALDTLVINAIALIVMVGILYESPLYFEAALLFAMVGFLTTVAFCKFILRGNVIE